MDKDSDTSLAQLVEALRAAVSPREQQTGEALSERADHLLANCSAMSLSRSETVSLAAISIPFEFPLSRRC